MEHQGIVSNVGNHDFFFVEDLETGEIFFCHAGFVQGEIFPKKGDKVSFDVGESPKGPNAVNVTRI